MAHLVLPKPDEDPSAGADPDEAVSAIDQMVFADKDQGAKQYQEDSTCLFHSDDFSVLMGAVFDGHGGLNGQVASNTCETLTVAWYRQICHECAEWSNSKWDEELKALFARLHQSIRDGFVKLETAKRKQSKASTANVVDEKGVVRKPSGFPIHGGTTASVVTIIRTKNRWRVICANTGDSDCLLLARKPAVLPDRKNYKHLSVDHSPDSAVEFLRIKRLDPSEYRQKLMFIYDKANQGRKYECPLVFLEDGSKDPKFLKNPWGNNLRPTNVRYDPAVYAVSPPGVSRDITCIAMTRSLGDFYAHQFGLSQVPDVQIEELDMENEYIIAAGSDGIWDCWKWEDFSDYVNGTMTKHFNASPRHAIKRTCTTVLRHTVARAKACFGESAYDDASLILFSLRKELWQPQGGAAAAATDRGADEQKESAASSHAKK